MATQVPENAPAGQTPCGRCKGQARLNHPDWSEDDIAKACAEDCDGAVKQALRNKANTKQQQDLTNSIGGPNDISNQ